MPKATRTLIGIALVGAAAFGVYQIGASLLGDGDDESQSTRHLVNQVWIERMPRSERDMVGHFGLVDHPRAKLGWVGRSSQWRHFAEFLHWRLSGHELSVVLPQENVRGKVNVRTWPCKDEAPTPFELCLELSADGRKMRYYSMKEWVIEPHDAEASIADLEARVPELRGVLDHAIPSDTVAAAATDLTEDANEELSDLSLLMPNR